MSNTFRVLAAIALAVVLGGIGIGLYNAGVSEGVAEAARAAQAAGEGDAVVYPPYVGGGPGHGPGYGYGGHGGFGFFGILFTILFLFLVFGLARAAFGWGRGGGHGGPGPGGWGGRDERIAEMHRELHRRDAEPHGTAS